MAFGEIYKYTWWGKIVTNGFGFIYQSYLSAIGGLLSVLSGRSDDYENESGTEAILTPLEDSGLLDKASIILTPTAYSTNFVNSVVPENGDGDFDFVRATTATRVNENGLIEEVAAGIPRIDYSSGVGQWLFEPLRTNLIRYTDDFSKWSDFFVNLTSNYSISPDGSSNSTLIEKTNLTYARVEVSLSGLSATTYCASVFIRGEDSFLLRIDYTGGSVVANINASNGVITNSTMDSAKSTYYGDGWYRFECVKTYPSAPTFFRMYPQDVDGGVANTNPAAIEVWGAQLEAGSYPTSYIPTSGSTKTRNADVANNSGNADLFNDSEGVLYAEIAALANDGTDRRISISDGSVDDKVEIFYSASSNVITAECWSGGVSQANLTHTLTDATDSAKIAIKYKVNDFALWVDGIEQDTSVSGSAPTGLNKLNLDGGAGADDYYGKITALSVFTEALTDEELEILTT